MKKVIISTTCLTLLSIGVSSCSGDIDYNNGAIPPAGKVWYSFYQTYSSAEAQFGDATAGNTVKVVRSTTEGDVTLPITITPEPGGHNTVEGVTVTPAVFKDGESEATVTWEVSNPVAPAVYTGYLTIDADVVSPSGDAKCNFYLTGPYKWDPMEGKGWIQPMGDGLIYLSGWYEVSFMKADGCQRWRVLEPMKECAPVADAQFQAWGWDGWSASAGAGAPYLEFYEIEYEDDSIEISFEPFSSGISASGKLIYGVPGNFTGTVAGTKINAGGNLKGNYWKEDKFLQLGVFWTGWYYTSDGVQITMPGY